VRHVEDQRGHARQPIRNRRLLVRTEACIRATIRAAAPAITAHVVGPRIHAPSFSARS